MINIRIGFLPAASTWCRPRIARCRQSSAVRAWLARTGSIVVRGLALGCAVLASAADAGELAPARSLTTSHFGCRVVSLEHLDYLGSDGHHAQLSHFRCDVTGGLLDGFSAEGTHLWDAASGGSERLLASLLVAQKGESRVVSELEQGARTFSAVGHAAHWQASAQGTYKLATGSASALTGRSFAVTSRSQSAAAFSFDAVLTN